MTSHMFVIFLRNGPMFNRLVAGEKVRSMTPEWVEANKEYMKFQKMNPIFGIGKGKY